MTFISILILIVVVETLTIAFFIYLKFKNNNKLLINSNVKKHKRILEINKSAKVIEHKIEKASNLQDYYAICDDISNELLLYYDNNKKSIFRQQKGQSKKIIVLLSYSVLLPERFFLCN